MSRGQRNRQRSWQKLGAGVAVGLFLLLLPLWVSSYIQSILIFIGLYSMVTLGLCLLMGYAGQISLGQSAFFGIGGYTTVILSLKCGVWPWGSLAAGAFLTGVVAYVLGKPFLRLTGFPLAVVTVAFAMLIAILAGRLDFLTGGHDGLTNFPRLSIGTWELTKDFHYYYLVLAALSLLFLFSKNLVRSKIGRAMRAVDLFAGGSETAAQSVGVNTSEIKLKIFVIAAVYAAVAGGIYANYIGNIHPGSFSAWWSILFVAMIVIGGSGNLWGAIIGPALYISIRESISQFTRGGIPAGWESVIFGMILVTILILLPGGIAELPRKLGFRGDEGGDP